MCQSTNRTALSPTAPRPCLHLKKLARQAPSSKNVDPSNYSTFFIATSAAQLLTEGVILITFLGKAYAY